MNKKKGKYYVFIGLLIAICILMNGIPASAVNSSEVTDKLNQIAQKYPDGSFFSANGQACTHIHNLTCSNCELLNIYPDLKGKVSDAWTCCAFARYVYYELFHINSYSISTNSKEVSLADAKAGDLVMFYNGLSISHYAIYLYADEINGKYYLYESDYGVPNKVRYSGAYSMVQMANVKIWHANNYVVEVTGDVDTNANANTDGNVPNGSLNTTVPLASLTPTPSLPILPSSSPSPSPSSSSSTPTPTPTPILAPTLTPTTSQTLPSLPVPDPNPEPIQLPKPTPTPKPIASTSMPISLPVPSAKPAPTLQSLTGKNTQISVTNIKMNKNKLELGKGKTFTLNATIVPQKASNKKVNWHSSNKSIATVSSTGIVKGIRKGITYIYVTSTDGKKEAKCLVIVY